MGWPKLNDQCRLYLERKDKSYILVITECGYSKGNYDIVGNAIAGNHPSLCSGSCCKSYLHDKCKRVQWSDLPDEWKKAFQNIMHSNEWDTTNPKRIKGFWKIDNWKELTKTKN